MKALLQQRGVSWEDGQLTYEPSPSFSQLLAQLAETSIVVATRFHNLLLAIALHKHTLAISNNKNSDSLLAGVGLGAYCQSIEDFDVETLIAQFQRAEQNASNVGPRLRKSYSQNLSELREQYTNEFGLLSRSCRS